MTGKVGELFSGPGGLGLAAHWAGFDHAWAVDNDPDACETYRLNLGGEVHCADVREFDLESLGEINGLAFGSPCNDHSVVGEHKGLDGEWGPLYSYGVKVLESHQPEWFLFENVGGIRSANDGEGFKKVLSDFREAGYRLVPHYYHLESYGAPQRRRRVMVVGVRDDQSWDFAVPAPSHLQTSVRQALWQANHERLKHVEHSRVSEKVRERLGHIRPGQNAWTADLPEHLKIKTNTTISSVYRRLHPDHPSYTVTSNGGGGTAMYHHAEPRPLTNRERARLQGFPDVFEFVGSRTSVRKQIGMAVPPTAAVHIFKAIRDSIEGSEYPSVESNLKEFA